MVGKLLLFTSLQPLPGGHYLGTRNILCAEWNTDLRMAETAEKVGYKNLSKLAAVLIKQFSCPPLEHHRRARLE